MILLVALLSRQHLCSSLKNACQENRIILGNANTERTMRKKKERFRNIMCMYVMSLTNKPGPVYDNMSKRKLAF